MSARKGRRIKTLKELRQAALDHRAVACPASRAFRGPVPAAWMLHQQGAILCSLLDSGMYLYPKPRRLKK